MLFLQNTILACQDQYFAGGQGYDCPYFSSTSEASVDVTKDTWVSLWASGLLDNKSSNQGPQSHGKSTLNNNASSVGNVILTIPCLLYLNTVINEWLSVLSFQGSHMMGALFKMIISGGISYLIRCSQTNR